MNSSSKGLLFTFLVGTSLTATAGNLPISACNVADVKITTIQLLNDDGTSPVVTLDSPENASDCLGAFSGNNSLFSGFGDNLGYDEDGWMNKENYQGWWNGPGAFVDNDDLLDLDGDDDVDDPGWVYVGKDEGDGFEGENSTDGVTDYDFIDDLITLNNCRNKNDIAVSCWGNEEDGAVSGNWVYTPPAKNPDDLTNLLGGDFFDQVAIVFKAGNNFAMYNFSIVDLGLDPVLAGDYNFAFTGTWDIGDTLGNSALSNLSFFARDPVHTATSVPEPTSWALMLIASLFLYRNRKNKI